MNTTRNKHVVSSTIKVVLVGALLFLISSPIASAYTLRMRTLPLGYSAGNSVGNNNGGVSTGNGGNGGSAGVGGLVKSGSVTSNANSVNMINTTIVRIGR